MERSQILNDPEQALRIAFDGLQSGVWTALPAIVTSVNWAALTLEAQPAVQGMTKDENGIETPVNLPPLLDVPIMFPSAGGFALTLPLAAGDEVLIVIASRCIDSWWQTGAPLVGGTVQTQLPAEVRMHDLSDGFAFPAQMSQPKVAQVLSPSQTNARLTNLAGTAYLELTSTGGVNILAPGGIAMTGTLAVTGAVTVTGALTATGEITAKQGTANIDLSGHKHTGVTTGGGNTGGPIP